MEEANAFAIESFDTDMVPEMSEFFEKNVDVSTMAFSAHFVPARLSHLIDTYSTIDYVDEYTFHLMKHIVNDYFKPSDEEAQNIMKIEEESRRARQRRRADQGEVPPIEVYPSHAVRG